jgi:malonate decarboxylase epsilon subunit
MIAFLYPGQGSQHVGMLASLPDSPSTRETLKEAAELLGPIDGLDTAESLTSTTNAQLALLICGVAAARTLLGDDVRPDIVAGHSVGAFAAAVGAGVLTFAEAVAAVQIRGDAMAQACASGQWGMAALTGLRPRVVRDLVDAEADGQLWIANINAVDQVVLGGTVTALDRVGHAAQHVGARRFEMLDVAVASHGPIQSDTAHVVAQYLSAVPRRDQQAVYMTNVGGRRIRDDAGKVLDDLATAVAHPVHWFDIVRLLPELGVVATVEMPPGHVLSRLVMATTPALTAFSVSDDGLAPIAARL